MIATIDPNGWLELSRHGYSKYQYCPFVNEEGENDSRCGDWCPLFDTTETELTLCQRSFMIEALIDQRAT